MSKLVLELLQDDVWFASHATYRLHLDLQIGGHTVPRGFRTDIISSPRWAWSLFPPVDKYSAEAVLHDYLLVTEGWGVANKEFIRLLAARDDIRRTRVWVVSAGVLLQAWWSRLRGKPYGARGRYSESSDPE